MLKIFSVRVSPDEGQYLYIVAAHTQEEARDLTKKDLGYEDEDWTIYPPQTEHFEFCEIKELPLKYEGTAPTIIDYGGCDGY